MMHTTYQLLRQAKACKRRYQVFRRGASALGYHGDTTPIPITVALDTNGLNDTLWTFRAVPLAEAELRDRLCRLYAADVVEHVAHLWVAIIGMPWNPADTIAVVRRYAYGQATIKELLQAREAADVAATAWVVAAEGAAAWASAKAVGVAARATAWASAAEAAAWASCAAATRAAEAAAASAARAVGVMAAEAERIWQTKHLREMLEA